MHELKDLLVPDSELEVSPAGASQPIPDSRLAPLIERTRARLAATESSQASFDEVLIQFVSAAERNPAINELLQRTHKLRAILQALTECASNPRCADSFLSEQTTPSQKTPTDRISELDSQLCEVERSDDSKEPTFNSHKTLFASAVSTFGKDKFIGIFLISLKLTYLRL